MLKKRYIIVAITIGIMVLQSGTFAQGVTKTGTTAAKFLSIGIGPRANAMGGSFSSVADDATAMYWNPAGLSQLQNKQVIFTQADWLADISINYVGLALPVGSFGTLGINATAMTMGDMEITTELLPEGTGQKFSAGMYAFGISYARNLTQNFMIGANFKYVREDISQSKATGLAIDLGTLFITPFYGVRFSSSISNFGSKMQMRGDDLLIRHDPDEQREGNNEKVDAYYATEKYDLPLRLQIGVSRRFEIMPGYAFTFAADAAHPNDNTEYVNVGGELSMLNNMFMLRGGFKTLFMEDREEGLTLGAGFNFNQLGYFDLKLDYSFQQFEYLNDVHTFGFLLSF
ncbi:MAG: PorV/PorQ family protein [Caldithrix sp.]|nr:PorV/PorQ family protein [Caldithrix sp.]